MSRKTWKEIYKCDVVMTGLEYPGKLIDHFRDKRYRFYRLLRKTEYITNTYNKGIMNFYGKLLRLRYLLLCDSYQWTIPINVFGPGLQIVHRGTIVVSGSAKVGKNCRIHVCTNIGRASIHGEKGAPIIGDNVYIGPGAKLFGPIVIGDNTVIGANAVVNKSFAEGNYTIAGVPAKIVSSNDSSKQIVNNCTGM